MNISVRLLKAFCALEECLQFTLAAKRCNLTQSAFSQLIGRLEQQVGMRLFERDTRSVRLTAEGKLFSAKAREILEHIERAMLEVQNYADKQHGRLAFAMVPSLAGAWAPTLLERFHNAHPAITLQIFDTYSERCLQLLREKQVDFGVTAQPGDPGEFLTSTLFEERFYLVCASKHAPTKSRAVFLRDLRGVPIIHLVQTESVRVVSASQMHHLRPMLRAAGAQDVGIEVEHASTLAGLVKQGIGCSVVPESMANQFKIDGIVSVPVSRSAFRRSIFLVQRQWDSLSPAAAVFIELMKAHLPQGAIAAKHNNKPTHQRLSGQ